VGKEPDAAEIFGSTEGNWGATVPPERGSGGVKSQHQGGGTEAIGSGKKIYLIFRKKRQEEKHKAAI